jgi:gliding motility-associated transport system ATP-binding protein
MSEMLDIQHLTKRFGNVAAVDDVTFAADRGEVVGFLGPNGAGKTTTMRMIVGFLAPTSGRAVVCGHDVVADPFEVKRRVGYLPEGAPLYEDMTPLALLGFVADVRGLAGGARREAIARAVDRLQLDEVLAQPIGTLSKGFKRRVGFAQAILHDPEVLILDEPTDGLDPNQKHEVRELIHTMAAGKAIVISTHLLEEVEAVCTRAVIIARGKLVFDGTPEALQAKSEVHNAVRIHVAPAAAEACRVNLAGLEGVARVDMLEATDGIARLIAVPAGGRSIVEAVSARLNAKGIAVEELSVERGRLDEVFRRMTVVS